MSTTLQERYENVVEEVREQCVACGRPEDAVRVIAVSKTAGAPEIAEAIEAGAQDLAENRPDRIVEMSGLFPQVRWHFIGNIQSRRIPDIVASATLIHSLYQLRHAEKIEAAAAALQKIQEVLIEVNVSGEESKSGSTPQEAPALVKACMDLPHVRVRGLMTMAPQGDAHEALQCFEGLAKLANDIRGELDPGDAVHFSELSMGMSEDWPEAVAAGGTMVRVGRAIFSSTFEA